MGSDIYSYGKTTLRGKEKIKEQNGVKDLYSTPPRKLDKTLQLANE